MAYAGISEAPAGQGEVIVPGQRPLPDRSDPLTQEFWAAANEERLVIQQCQSCTAFHHPGVGLCTACLSDDLKYVPVSGKGHVYSYSVVYDQRVPAFDPLVPYIVATIELDELPGTFLQTNLPGTSIDEVEFDLPVAVTFEEIAPGVRIPQFRVEKAEAE